MAQDDMITVATRLFAELGYDSTTTEILAEAAGTDKATLTRATGGKRELYGQVMRRAFDSEQDMLEQALTGFNGGLSDIHDIVDSYLDFYIENPLIVSLWMHRWMGDAADVTDLEATYVQPQALGATGLVVEMVPADVNADYLFRTVVWCVFGFLSGGMPTSGPRVLDAPSSAQITEFRQYLHTVVDRMLAPPPAPRAAPSAPTSSWS